MMKINNVRNSKLPLKEKKKVRTMAAFALAYLLCGSGLIYYCRSGYELKENNIFHNLYLKYSNEKVLEEIEKHRLLQDINGNWKQYDEIIEVNYKNKNANYQKVLIMGLEERNGNQSVYHSITDPSLYLIETIDNENYQVDYIIKTTGFTNEESREAYSKEQEVTDVVWILGIDDWSFEKIAKDEKRKEKQLNGENLVALPNLFSETDTTLFQYNSWLEKIGSNKRLTKADLEFIEANTNNGIISIKLQNNEHTQVGNDYLVVENKEGELELILDFAANYNLFTGNKRKKIDYRILGSFEEYALANNIESIGYTPQLWPGWSDKDTAFIRENYGDDILECLRENGYPLPSYDVNDFYEAYYKSKFEIPSMGARW